MTKRKGINPFYLVLGFLAVNLISAGIVLWLNVELFDNTNEMMRAFGQYWNGSVLILGSFYVLFWFLGGVFVIRFQDVLPLLLIYIATILFMISYKQSTYDKRWLFRCHVEGCEGEYSFQD